MTREEIKEKMKDLADRYFALQMQDRWSREDYELSSKLNNEYNELEKMLKGLE